MPQPELRFAFLPAGGQETASSRIRVYALQRALKAGGVDARLGFHLGANVFFFQKKVTGWNLFQARIAKMLGRVVIYDVDDLGGALWYWVAEKNFRKMLQIAHVVTTCSAKQLDLIRQRHPIKSGHVISNTVDYFPDGPVKLEPRDTGSLRIVWFGNSSNFSLFEKYVEVLLGMQNTELFAIVDESDIQQFRAKYPKISFLPWTVNGFIPKLQQYDLAALMHDGAPEDQAKGNNKMITAITWGVPAVVSRTPEYERTARESGVEYALFSNDDELVLAVERLRTTDARKSYLDVAQPKIWERYSPDVVAKQLLCLAGQAYLKLKGGGD